MVLCHQSLDEYRSDRGIPPSSSASLILISDASFFRFCPGKYRRLPLLLLLWLLTACCLRLPSSREGEDDRVSDRSVVVLVRESLKVGSGDRCGANAVQDWQSNSKVVETINKGRFRETFSVSIAGGWKEVDMISDGSNQFEGCCCC